MWKFKWCKRMGMVLAIGGTFFFGGSQAGAEPAMDGMTAFREAYMAVSAKEDNRIFLENINFLGPTFHADMDFQGQVLDNGFLRMAGKINWGFTAKDMNKDNTVQMEIPFYVEHEKDSLVLYGQYEQKWYRLAVPGIPAELTKSLKSTNVQDLTEAMTVVKAVTILKEDEKQRSMNILLDGAKVADLLVKYSKDDRLKTTPQEEKEHQEILQRLSTVLKQKDVPISWTVDKENWRTVTVGMDFTDIMRSYAQSVLKDAAEGRTSVKDDDREFLEALGYYSELHAYTTYMGVEKKSLTVPEEVRKTATDVNFFAGLQPEVASSVTK